MARRDIGVRWTIGDVTPEGFEALYLSIWGAFRLFGPAAAYSVSVNGVSPERARRLTGPVPDLVDWQDATGLVPRFLEWHLGPGMAEGAGWKLAPCRSFPDLHELALDNDCILWRLPEVLDRWSRGEHGGLCVLAEDVEACFGQFAELCGPEPRNAGIRGLPPGFDFESALRRTLREAARLHGREVRLSSETDEQGLQTAALATAGPPLVVTLDEVSLCSPFWPHEPELGRSGAHFIGLNARRLPWSYYDRPAELWVRENWQRHRASIYERLGLRLGSRGPREASSSRSPSTSST